MTGYYIQEREELEDIGSCVIRMRRVKTGVLNRKEYMTIEFYGCKDYHLSLIREMERLRKRNIKGALELGYFPYKGAVEVEVY